MVKLGTKHIYHDSSNIKLFHYHEAIWCIISQWNNHYVKLAQTYYNDPKSKPPNIIKWLKDLSQDLKFSWLQFWVIPSILFGPPGRESSLVNKSHLDIQVYKNTEPYLGTVLRDPVSPFYSVTNKFKKHNDR